MKRLLIIAIVLGFGLSTFGQVDTIAYSAGVTKNKNIRDKLNEVVLSHDTLVAEWETFIADTIPIDSVALLREPDVNAQTGTSYTLVYTDRASVVTLTNAASIALTVPPNADVAFPLYTQITIIQLGAGVVTVGPGSGVTVNSYGTATALSGQYAVATLFKIDTNTWLLFGNIQ